MLSIFKKIMKSFEFEYRKNIINFYKKKREREKLNTELTRF